MRKIRCVALPGWFVLLASLIPLCAVQAQTYSNFTTIDEPLAVSSDGGTYVEGIYSNTVVGYYYNATGRHGFYHVLGTTNYTTLDNPLSFSSVTTNTAAYGISGRNIVGWYQDEAGYTGTYGFVYNLDSGIYYKVEDASGVAEGVSSTETFGIDGTNIVGLYDGNGVLAGDVFSFLATFNPGAPGSYNYTSFYIPIAERINSNSTNYNTQVSGISGNAIIGSAVDTSNYRHGFVYYLNSSTYTLLTNSAGGFIYPYGIQGNQVVGYFSNPANNYNYSGFLLTLGTTNLLTIDTALGTNRTFAQGISDGRIVGYYIDNNSYTHGFVVGNAPLAPPVMTLQHATGSQFIFTVTNGLASAPFNILSATNLLPPFNHWSLVLSNNFDTNGNFVVTNTFSRAIPGTFYRVLEYP